VQQKSRAGFAVLMIQLLARSPANATGVDFVNVKPTPAINEYCHVVRFFRGWKIRGLDFNREPLYIDNNESDYEFRVEGLLGTSFLVGAFKPNLPHRYDATNHYRVNLSDPTTPVVFATRKDWEVAAVVPLARKSIVPYSQGMSDYQAVFNGYTFTKSGHLWAYSEFASRLSPDSAWVVLQSKTHDVKSSSLPAYRVFFDVYSADTGKKTITVEGTYSGLDDPDGCLKETAWLTERYFIIPLGKSRDRCLVCEFGARRRQGGKP
jgi:hypothetical protein